MTLQIILVFATIDEGVELRKAGLKQPILLLGLIIPPLFIIRIWSMV